MSSNKAIAEFLKRIETAYSKEDGEQLAALLNIKSDLNSQLARALSNSDESYIRLQLCAFDKRRTLQNCDWIDLLVPFVRAVVLLNSGSDMSGCFSALNSAVVQFQKLFSALDRQFLPVLYIMNRQLCLVARKADKSVASNGSATHLEEAARTLNKSFTLCVTDRDPLPDSRKWGTYYMINLLMPVYARLNTRNLCRNLVRAASVGEMPQFERFPMAQQVTFKFYSGLEALWDEQYAEAEKRLCFALSNCYAQQVDNRRHVLEYLIPLRLATTGVMFKPIYSAPESSQLPPYIQKLFELYNSFYLALISTSLKAYDLALEEHKEALFGTGVYLLMETARWLCARNCVRKLWLIGDKDSRLSLANCQLALNLSATMDLESEKLKKRRKAFPSWNTNAPFSREQVECILANLIERSYIKGYLSHDKGYLVLSQQNPFPSFSSVNIV